MDRRTPAPEEVEELAHPFAEAGPQFLGVGRAGGRGSREEGRRHRQLRRRRHVDH